MTRPRLRAVASALGIEDGYVSALDGRLVETSDATREALAGAMGFDVSSEAAAESALARLGPMPPASDPRPCPSFRERLGRARAFGLWTNLYTLRSPDDFGFGDLGDLRVLVRWAAAQGAAFVGLNPLHALANRAGDVCPYAPVSRLFRNPLYLRVEDVPELARAPEARERLAVLEAQRETLRAAAELDARAIEVALLSALRPLHAAFQRAADPARRRAHARHREARGEALVHFATFQALADAQERRGGGRDWRRWPRTLRDPGNPEVGAFRSAHAAEVDFHAWLQFELERQLEAVADEARSAGMPIGLYTDLALGSAPSGFDAWAYPELFARGASLGAPPDAFSREGQDWGLPPLDPHAQRREGFRFWRSLLEAGLCGAGALRIDHALGLRRLFWIPEGASPREGAYVRSPELELLAVLGEVSSRTGALVIGEDLGTVPEGFSREIQARGLLSSRVLLFERDEHGFRPSAAWPEACLASANTHDLPPLAAWLDDGDLALRCRTGQIPDAAARLAIETERALDRSALRERLLEEGDLPAEAAPDDLEAWSAAITRFLCRTPAALVALSLDDLAGERVPVNLPGVAPARHASWVRRMGRALPELCSDRGVLRVLEAVPAFRRLR